MQHKIQLSDELKLALLNPLNMPRHVQIHGVRYMLKKPVKAGFKGAVWQVTDHFGRARALKFATYDDYVSRSFLDELQLAARMEQYPEFATFIDADKKVVQVKGFGRQTFVVTVEEWIDGETLEDYVHHSAESITSSIFLSFVRTLCHALQALEANGLTHDDLHAGNVMLARPPMDSLRTELTFKVIDLGSLKLRPSIKPMDDHHHFRDTSGASMERDPPP